MYYSMFVPISFQVWPIFGLQIDILAELLLILTPLRPFCPCPPENRVKSEIKLIRAMKVIINTLEKTFFYFFAPA